LKRFRNILLYVDPAKSADAAYERACALCRESGASLGLLAVAPALSVYLRYPQFAYPSLEDTLRKEAEDALAKLAGSARGKGLEVSAKVRHGKPYLEISREVLAGGYDLVMLTAEEEGGEARSTSTAMHLFRVCPSAVWAVRPPYGSSYDRILAAVDPSAETPDEKALNGAILECALALAELEKASVDVLHAWHCGPEWAGGFESLRGEVGAVAQESFDALMNPYALDAERLHLVEGAPERLIPEFVEEHRIDLLVMGTVVRTGIAGAVIGNTAERCLGKVECSVLALKPAGFVSPVEPEPRSERE
jgi:nucleotide-binding universal stress UspA family protein